MRLLNSKVQLLSHTCNHSWRWQLQGALQTPTAHLPQLSSDCEAHHQDGWLHLQTRQITRLGRIK